MLFSRHIPYRQVKDLVEKLESLSNVYFKSQSQYIYPPSENRTDNKQLFYNIGVLDEAIRKNQKFLLNNVEYHTDKKLIPERERMERLEYIL